MHSNLYHSPVWPLIYPSNITANLHACLRSASYLVAHQINSGLSYGVFDTQYTFKRESSRATDGALYFNASEPSIQDSQGIDAESKRLLDQMDFPLVSIALSYDSFYPLDQTQMVDLVACLPLFGTAYHELAVRDAEARDAASWQAEGPGEVLFRNATSTRREYEGEGIMAGLARWLIREVDGLGWRGVQIETFNDAVFRVWSQPEKAVEGEGEGEGKKWKAVVASEFDAGTYVDGEGQKLFAPSKQHIAKVYVELKPKVSSASSAPA
ncbi:hypothetical protein K491DRAFT_688338 [Lophiostoma macrostomum CBS 122681]|uniref:N-acetyltransferase domain-containing protein n=1 Tax=Lophiostoma macrostomum CBS 122681 TaxID=1314788 RepID=A0A6A6TN34_9PLEO|nr:hypothetical protein K491DRAFT_688338 [Lophiostoma macrostomum CBS 122681]